MIFKFRTLEQTNFPYQIEFPHEYDISEVTDWCIETFGKYNVIFEYYCIRLKTNIICFFLYDFSTV